METKFNLKDTVDVLGATFLDGGIVTNIEIENEFSDKPIYLIRDYQGTQQFWYREHQIFHAINPKTD